MPGPRASRNVAAAFGKASYKSLSFHGRGGSPTGKLRRLRTLPDLPSWERNASPASPTAGAEKPKPKLTKVLWNVTVQGSVGAVQVLMSPESTVRDLISTTLKQYLKEGGRPVISGFDVDDFDLHYSQFSLERLDREEKISALGSRNFFMCKRKAVGHGGANGGVRATSCSTQAEKATRVGFPFPWLKFMNFLF